MSDPLQVEVMSVDGKVWEGSAVRVVARTSEGDIGILPGHEPLMAVLVPSAVEVLTAEGIDETIAVSDGFVSVFNNRVSLLSSFAELAEEISLDKARSTVAELHKLVDDAQADHDQLRAYNRAVGQLRAAGKYQARQAGQGYMEITPAPAVLPEGN